MKPWEKREKETSKAFARFEAYLRLGPDRTLAKLAEALARPGRYVATLRKWCWRHAWVKRSEAFDAMDLQEQIEKRRETREAVRQTLFNRAHEAVRVVHDILTGVDLPGERQEDGLLVVKPSTRLQAAIRILELIGLTPPKRIEITGPDGKDLEIAARHKLEQLPTETLEGIREVLRKHSKEGAAASPDSEQARSGFLPEGLPN